MDHDTQNGVPDSLEAGIASTLRTAQESLREQYLACEQTVRRSPGSSMLIAGVAGYVFRSLPVGALLGGIVRLILALLRPAILIYVAAKGYEVLTRESASAEGKPVARSRPARAARGGN